MSRARGLIDQNLEQSTTALHKLQGTLADVADGLVARVAAPSVAARGRNTASGELIWPLGSSWLTPREYRRGVVLGLTMAEVLVLLVFLLLLTMAALLFRRDKEQAAMAEKLGRYAVLLQPVTEALASRGIMVEDNGPARQPH